MVSVTRGTRKPSATDISYTWLKARIADLPSDIGMVITEAEVSAGAETGRTPAREALQRLAIEGYLQILPRKGAFIPPISDAQIKDVMEGRRLVEGWSVRRVIAQANLSADDLDAIVAEQRGINNDPVEFIAKDRAFHQTIVDHGGNAVLSGFYQELRDRQVRMGLLALAGDRERAERVLREHVAIVDAIKAKDAEAACRAVDEHLANTLSVLLGAET